MATRWPIRAFSALVVFTFLAALTDPVVAQPKINQVRPGRTIYKPSTGPLKTPLGMGTKSQTQQSTRGGRWTHALFEKVRGEVQKLSLIHI